MRELQTLNRPGPSLYSLAKRVGGGFDDGNDAGADFYAYFRKMQIACGVNDIFQVNDTQDITDWTESDDTTFDITNDTSGRVGTNEAKFTSTATCDGTQYIETDYINQSVRPYKDTDGSRQMDWRDSRYIGFWVTNKAGGDFSTAGELKMALVGNGGVESDQVNVQAIVDTVHQFFQIDMLAQGWDLNQVEKIRFYANVASGEDIYINNIIRYDLSYGRGPLYGGMFPVTSGTALSDNELVAWSIDGLVASSGSAAIADLGPVRLFKNGRPVSAATGDAGRLEAHARVRIRPGSRPVPLVGPAYRRKQDLRPSPAAAPRFAGDRTSRRACLHPAGARGCLAAGVGVAGSVLVPGPARDGHFAAKDEGLPDVRPGRDPGRRDRRGDGHDGGPCLRHPQSDDPRDPRSHDAA